MEHPVSEAITGIDIVKQQLLVAGGSFLTLPANALLRFLFGNNLYYLPWWWAYSVCLGLFFVSLPFSRYMHILTEPLLILLRNAGIKVRHPRKGYAEAEIYACSSCGLCIDECDFNAIKYENKRK